MGVVAAIIILVSLLITVIAILCMRYTIQATMEQQFREIGVLKAVGMPLSSIKKIYFLKYVLLTLIAVIVGYGVSLLINDSFTKNMMLYMGEAPTSLLQKLIPLIAVLALGALILMFCLWTFRKFKNISAVDALRESSINL